MERELAYWVAFSRIPSVGRVRFTLLEKHFGSLEKAWSAGTGELRAAGLDPNVVNAIAAVRGRVQPDEELTRLERAGVQAITWHDDAYPELLRHIPDLPPILFVKGSLLPQDGRSVTVVGTRKATAYGREVARHLAGDLARQGVTVVSGLARGIDGVAHRAALDAGGRTIAVLGSGIDVIYPPEHANLADEVQHHGAVVSEYPLGTRPEARNFPRRNRLLSGLTLGTLVVEAGEASGALWSVRHALEQGREVFCVPGSIYSPASRLTNTLIQEGAKLVLGVEDILEELNLTAVAASQEPLPGLLTADTPDEAQLLTLLSAEPVHIDALSRQSQLSITSVSGALTLMEMKGLVRQVGTMNYIRTREASEEYRTSLVAR